MRWPSLRRRSGGSFIEMFVTGIRLTHHKDGRCRWNPMNKPGRNDPCPCGSGKKYKQCCLSREQAARPRAGALERDEPFIAELRSEERRVGKECRSRWEPCEGRKK